MEKEKMPRPGIHDEARLEKRQELYEKGEKKVEAILDFYDLAEENRFDSLNEFGNKIKSKLTQTLDEDFPGKFEENNDEDPDSLFTKKVNIFAGNILRNKEKCEKYETMQRDKFIAHVKSKYQPDFDDVDFSNVDIRFDGYSVIMELPEEEFLKTGSEDDKTRTGFVINNIIFLLKDSKDKKEALQHEKKHILTLSFLSNGLYAPDFINSLKDGIEKEELTKEDIVKIISNYAWMNEDEIIADLDKIPERKVGTYLFNFSIFLKKMDEFLNSPDLAEKDELAKEMDTASELATDRFVGTLKRLSDMFYASKNFGEEEFLKGSLVLYGGKKIGSIGKAERQLKYHLGKKMTKEEAEKETDKFDALKILTPLASEGYFLEGMEKYQNQKEGEDEDLVKEFKQKIKDKLGVKSFFEIDNLQKLNSILSKNKTEIGLVRKIFTDEIEIKSSLEGFDLDELSDKSKDDLKTISLYLDNIAEIAGISEFREVSHKIQRDLL